MLTINLLPIRQLKKIARAKNEIFCFISFLFCFSFLLGCGAFLLNKKVAAIQAETTKLQQEKQGYDKILAEIKKLEADKQELENKIKIINNLKKDSSLTVRVLDDVAKKMDTSRTWLTAFDQQGNTMSLTGKALDNKTIAEFMNALDLSSFISDVNLSDSSLATVAGQDLKAFSLQSAVGFPAEKTEPADQKTNQQKK